MTRLLYDCFRCEGKNCERKDTCLRHIALDDLGSRTPIMENACGWFSDEYDDNYIPITKEIEQ